jgi:anti-sigma B factor antagonist
MEIKEHPAEGALVLEVVAERLDSDNSPGFKSRILDLANAGNDSLVLDLSKVEFMDSTGLAALVHAIKTLAPHGDLAVFGLNDRLRKLFGITRLDRGVIKIAETREQAVDMVPKRR